MTVPTPPAVSDAMREAVAPVTRAEVRACIGPTIPLRRRWVDLLMQGPIARLQAETARLTGEREAANAAFAWAYERALAAEAETARLRAERLILDKRIHDQRVALRQNWEITEMRNKDHHRAAVRTRLLAICCRLRAELNASQAALAEAEARGRRQGLEEADDREIKRILGLSETEVALEIEIEGRDPAVVAETLRGQMGATFRLCEEIKTLRDALASNAQVDAVLKAVLTPAGDPEHGSRDRLPRVLRDFLNEECGRAGLTGFNDGYAEGYAKALATAPAETQKPEETA